jgi:hypothetical protein
LIRGSGWKVVNVQLPPISPSYLHRAAACGHDACGRERAADALHCANRDSTPRGDLAHALSAARILQGIVDSLFQLRGYRRTAKRLALTDGPF